MKKIKVLVPLDGTKTSMHSLRQLKKMFNAEDIEITLMHVVEIVVTDKMLVVNDVVIGGDAGDQVVVRDGIKKDGNNQQVVLNHSIITTIESVKRLKKDNEPILDDAIKEMEGYTVEKFITFGYAADEILKKAKEDNFNIIIMTKSNKTGFARMLGSVTSKVVKNAEVLVIIVPQ